MSEITKIKVDGEPESSYQLYPRNEEFAKRSEGVQPDWNQNDDTKQDYVKNRTHWTEPEILDVIFQQDDVALHDATDFLQAKQLLVFSEELVVGDTYNVNIDGVDHYVVCYTSNGEVHLGKEWPDRFMLFGSGSSATLYLYEFNYGSTVRLTITHITPSKIHKIDPKYMPDVDLEILVNIDNYGSKITDQNMQITAGSVEDVYAKLANGVVPKVVIKYFNSVSTSEFNAALANPVSISYYDNSIHLSYIIEDDGDLYQHGFRLAMDGTIIESFAPGILSFQYQP